MKKAIFFLFIFCKIVTVFSEDIINNLPSEVSPNSFVFDKNDLTPVPKDDFTIITSYNVKGNFEIYASNDNTNWNYLGNIDIPNYLSSKSLKIKNQISTFKVRKYRYYCIDFQDNEKIEYTIKSKNDNIYIKAYKNEKLDFLEIDNKTINSGFYILDYSDIDVDDYFKLENTTTKSNFKVLLYVLDSNKGKWIYAGTASLKGYGDVDTVETDIDVEDYKVVALISENNMDFTCRASERHSDLYIELCDNATESISSPTGFEDLESKLKELKVLYDKGYIDLEEYKQKKNQILGL